MTTPAGPARAALAMISILTPDPQRLARFWSELMGLPVADGASDDLVMLDLDHEIGPLTWIFERSEDVARGTAPYGLDIGDQEDDEHWAEVATRAEELGAQRHAEHDENGVRWIEMSDPDGHRFRVFAPRPLG